MNWKKCVKSYSSIITKNIPLFLAVGFLNILFSDTGWFPNENMDLIANYLYRVVIPVLLGYYAGKRPGNQVGGIAGSIAALGLVCANSSGAAIGAILAGGIAGWVTDDVYKQMEKHLPSGFEMITKNVTIAFFGIIFSGFSFYMLAPCFNYMSKWVFSFLNMLISLHLLPAIHLLIEPMKILFLNNYLNHGVFIPLGMEQLETAQTSILFLMESNPGPGLGVLLACFMLQKENKRDTASVMAIHVLGGIHEVYFPYILSDLRLLLALIAGGAAGTWFFDVMQVGLKGPVSPGSILTILLMADANEWLLVIIGVSISTVVSCSITGILEVYITKKTKGEKPEVHEPEKTIMNPIPPSLRSAESIDKSPSLRSAESIKHIYVVCDAGLGSSAMGAALLRRKVKEAGLLDVSVQAAPFDDIPTDADLLVCQKDFYSQMMQGHEEIETIQIDRLTNAQAYTCIIERIRKGGL